MTVKVFKMVNGEDILANVKQENADYFVIDKPAVIVIQRTEKGEPSVGLAPYMPYVDDEIKLMTTAISCEATPDVKLANEYSRLFGSGIQIANIMPN